MDCAWAQLHQNKCHEGSSAYASVVGVEENERS